MEILLKPLVTEKASALNEQNQYGFIVNRKANKVQIKKAIENTYGVTVESVNTMRYFGKKKRQYTKSRILEGRKPHFKKAIVTVSEGEVIDFYSGI